MKETKSVLVELTKNIRVLREIRTENIKLKEINADLRKQVDFDWENIATLETDREYDALKFASLEKEYNRLRASYQSLYASLHIDLIEEGENDV